MGRNKLEWRVSAVKYYLICNGELSILLLAETDNMGVRSDASAICESDWDAMCDEAGGEAELMENLGVVYADEF